MYISDPPDPSCLPYACDWVRLPTRLSSVSYSATGTGAEVGRGIVRVGDAMRPGRELVYGLPAAAHAVRLRLPPKQRAMSAYPVATSQIRVRWCNCAPLRLLPLPCRTERNSIAALKSSAPHTCALPQPPCHGPRVWAPPTADAAARLGASACPRTRSVQTPLNLVPQPGTLDATRAPCTAERASLTFFLQPHRRNTRRSSAVFTSA